MAWGYCVIVCGTYILSTVSTVWIHCCKKSFRNLVHIDIVCAMFYHVLPANFSIWRFHFLPGLLHLLSIEHHSTSPLLHLLSFLVTFSSTRLLFFIDYSFLVLVFFSRLQWSLSVSLSYYFLWFLCIPQVDFQRILLIFLFHTCIQIWFILSINITLFIMYVYWILFAQLLFNLLPQSLNTKI